MYLLYTCLTALGAILLLPYFVFERWRRDKHFHGLRERLGYLPPPLKTGGQAGSLWIHAVSVGEVLAVTELARHLKQQYPGLRLLVSTTTATGQALARQRLTFAEAIFYFPFDWPGAVRRTFDAVTPRIVLIVETEIWPNFLREAARRGVPVVFVNGRISERSFVRSRRWLPLAGGFLRRVLAGARLFLMQSEADAERVVGLGADPGRVEALGNLKYDVAPPAAGPLVNWLAGRVQASGEASRRAVLVAGSVVAGEEALVAEAFRKVLQKFPGALLVLAPRKPERFEPAAALLVQAGLRFVRRTQLDLSRALETGTQVLLLDTVGELAALYRVADVAFVGGSLVPAGGHNVLEPAWFGKAPLFGLHMENFREMARQFVAETAGIQVASSADLAQRCIELLENPGRGEQMGRAARLLVERNRGATERTLARISHVLDEQEAMHTPAQRVDAGRAG